MSKKHTLEFEFTYPISYCASSCDLTIRARHTREIHDDGVVTNSMEICSVRYRDLDKPIDPVIAKAMHEEFLEKAHQIWGSDYDN